MIRHFIGVILLFLAAVLTPLAEFLKCFIGAYIVDVIITYSGHTRTTPYSRSAVSVAGRQTTYLNYRVPQNHLQNYRALQNLQTP